MWLELRRGIKEVLSKPRALASIPSTHKPVSKGLNRHFNNEDVQMTEKSYKMPKIYPAERGKQIQITSGSSVYLIDC